MSALAPEVLLNFPIPLLAALIVETLLYGIYIVLFFICTYILATRRKKSQVVLLEVTLIMFVLVTVDISVTIRFALTGSLPIVGAEAALLGHFQVKFRLYVTNNLLGDSLLIYRCYVIWGRRKAIVAVLSLVLIPTTVFGYLGLGTSDIVLEKFGYTYAYVWITFGLNIITTALTAGRIWWISKQARQILGPSVIRRYNVAVAVILESGLIYSTCLALTVFNFHEYRAIVNCLVSKVVCIMPILVIVQVEVGRGRQDVDATTETAPSGRMQVTP